MAPGTRRANRGGYVEHDDFEGLPVRQWRQEIVNVAPPPPPETTRKNDIWSRELLWGMPRDAGLLPQHSQDLLRAARSGRLYKRPAPAEEEEVDPEAPVEKPEKKEEEEEAVKGFHIKIWRQVHRNAEGATVSHLAKRRKGTVTIASKTVTTPAVGATVTKATVRKVDAAGNAYTQEITLQDGQQVEGEIISTTVVPAAVAAPQAQATPPRNRRPPLPKKNKKPGGLGRGRKRKTLPLPAPAPGQERAVGATVPTPAVPGVEGATTPQQDQREGSNNADSEMADNDNDDDEGDDDGDDGEDGEDGEDQDQEMTDASPAAPPASADTTMDMGDAESPSTNRQLPPPSQLLAPPFNLSLSTSPKLEGSPLKNVVMPSPTVASPQATSPPAEKPEPAEVTASEPEKPKVSEDATEAAAEKVSEDVAIQDTQASAPETKAETTDELAKDPTPVSTLAPAAEPSPEKSTAPAPEIAPEPAPEPVLEPVPESLPEPLPQPVNETLPEAGADNEKEATAGSTKSPSEEALVASQPPAEGQAEVEISQASTFIPPPERVGDIVSPEPTTDVPMQDAEDADEVVTQPVTEVAEPAEEAKPAEVVTTEVTITGSVTEPVVDEVADVKPVEQVTPVVEEVTETKDEGASAEAPKLEEVPATESVEPVEEPAPVAELIAQPAVVESTPLAAAVRSPTPPAPAAPKQPSPEDDGPDLLTGLETALDRQAEDQKAPELAVVEAALAPTEEKEAQPEPASEETAKAEPAVSAPEDKSQDP
ncbi:hypothetical protein VDGD_02658 [Verticillium dahliae]|nr:hypothetical protein VDGD_02658 [Verticillium dahliae]